LISYYGPIKELIGINFVLVQLN